MGEGKSADKMALRQPTHHIQKGRKNNNPGPASGLVILTICIIIYRKSWWILFTCCRLICHDSSSHGYQPLNAEDGQGWSYDAYISYSGDDYDWVLQHLLPGIDSGELTEEQLFNGEFKLFFHDRDSVPGSSVMSNITDNMEESKKVIIVLTKKYLSSDLYKFEIELAVKLKTDGTIDDIIVVNVSGVPDSKIPKCLHRKVAKNDFLEWEEDENAMQVFKQRLIDQLRRVGGATEVIV
uniref:Toll-like receptor 2 type-2 n=1 Tax=Crassostrea virginica TaxID=6565 RepID=A0A8B8E8Q2_CRAVI|nr:toll-like receptor 2 type-2 [Crassostrea virginica]